MHAPQQTTIEYLPIRKKGIISYSSKFFAATSIATFAALGYWIIDGAIYGFKSNRYLNMLILSSFALAAALLTLVISYGVFKCYNKKCDSSKEADKIITRKAVSISGKVFTATLAIGATFLACTLITNAVNGQDIPFLSLVRETFGFSKNGAWIGGSGGLLLYFMASSFVVLAIAGLMHLYSKDKDVSQDSRYSDASKKVHKENMACLDSDSSISSLLSEAENVGNKESKKKEHNRNTSEQI